MFKISNPQTYLFYRFILRECEEVIAAFVFMSTCVSRAGSKARNLYLVSIVSPVMQNVIYWKGNRPHVGRM